MELVKKLSAIKEEIKANGESEIREYIKNVFKAEPRIKSFSWVQYTPYFNDGDVCEFGVHGPQFLFTEEAVAEFDALKVDVDDEDDDDCGLNSWSIKRLAGELPADKAAPAKSLWKAIDQIENDFEAAEELLELAFGDGVKVKATPEGIEVTEYSHD